VGIVLRVISWIRLNGAALIGILQGIIKVIKELLTLIVDLISLILGHSIGQVIVDKVRDICNMLDGLLEKAKSFLGGSLL